MELNQEMFGTWNWNANNRNVELKYKIQECGSEPQIKEFWNSNIKYRNVELGTKNTLIWN